MTYSPNLELCINYIEQGKCVLLLGPQFAIGANGEKAYKVVREALNKTRFHDKLDFSYDNLFIFNNTNPKVVDRMSLNIELKKSYEELQPHPVYNKLAHLPFSAIISCSPDNYLASAFGNSIAHSFSYYSAKGTAAEKAREIDNTAENATILYNVFGSVSDEDSLITTYEGFFKFVVSILGDEHKLPIELRTRIKDARVFMMMGFDLTRWYIPLLIHKFDTFKQRNDTATAMRSADNKTGEFTDRLFPMDMLVLEDEAIHLIEKIYSKLSQNNKLTQSRKQGSTTVIDELKELMSQNEIEAMLNKMQDYFKEAKLDENEIIFQEARHNLLRNKIRKNTITAENARVETALLNEALLGLVEELREKLEEPVDA